MEVYTADGKLPGGLSVSVDIRVGYDPRDSDRIDSLAQLTKVLESLTPGR
jgi:hypothetical protein